MGIMSTESRPSLNNLAQHDNREPTQFGNGQHVNTESRPSLNKGKMLRDSRLSLNKRFDLGLGPVHKVKLNKNELGDKFSQ